MAATTIDRQVDFEPGWLSWIAAVRACLRALDVDCDSSDVGGHSGYAFALSINKGLCPSGPTFVDWNALSSGIQSLGRSTLTYVSGDCHTPEAACDRTRAHWRAVYELIRGEIESGRPCVIWGAGVPEFGVVRGMDEEGYICVPGGPVPERAEREGLNAPGGPYALAFPTPAAVHEDADRMAIHRALLIAGRPDHQAEFRCGLSAYEYWIEQPESGQAGKLGHSYNVQCWAEARRQAKEFLARLRERNEFLAPALDSSLTAFGRVSAALDRLAELFPFTFDAGKVEPDDTLREAVAAIGEARAREEEGLRALHSALERWP